MRLGVGDCAGGDTSGVPVSFRRNVRNTSTILTKAVMIRTERVTINHGPRSGKVNKNSLHEPNIIGTLSKSILEGRVPK